MIKQLKSRFTAVLTVVLSVMMLIICAAIYIFMYNTTQDNTERILSMAMYGRAERRAPYQTEIPAPSSARPDAKPDEKPSEKPDADNVRMERQGIFGLSQLFSDNRGMNTGWIRLRLTEDGTVEDIFLSQYRSEENSADAFSQATADETAQSILAEGGRRGDMTINGTHYRYGYDREKRVIVLLDTQNDVSVLNRLLLMLICVFVLTFFAFLILSAALARWIAIPIEDSWSRQTIFFSNASHELKTPLAVISSNLDVITGSPDKTVREQERWFSVIREETAKMSGLINEMLYLSREEHSESTVMAEFDLSRETERSCLAMEALAYENGKTLTEEISPDITVKGDKESLVRVVHILIDNAVKHSPAGSDIKISLSQSKGKARLAVRNTGTIAAEDLERIFDRYYRPDASRSRETGGYGLGLAIAKAVTEKHGGNISAASDDGETVFTVTIPCERNDKQKGVHFSSKGK
ncbi:MAG: GHKL domain-containing protein [Oscillospiraceae bacterium]|nr:GHKL domain-containing protein [Oscillospiraceae bacterium]